MKKKAKSNVLNIFKKDTTTATGGGSNAPKSGIQNGTSPSKILGLTNQFGLTSPNPNKMNNDSLTKNKPQVFNYPD